MRYRGEFIIANISETYYLVCIVEINNQGTNDESLIVNVLAEVSLELHEVTLLKSPIREVLSPNAIVFTLPIWAIHEYIDKKLESNNHSDVNSEKYTINGSII